MAPRAKAKYAESRKKKRISKKKKIAWRKHCDTDDVEDYLEDKRHEERVGINFTEAEDDKLFVIDTQPSSTNANRPTAPIRRELAEDKTPKCFQILLPDSAVPDPIAKRNRVRTPDERKHPLVKQIEERRKAQGIVKAKERQANLNRKFHIEQIKNRSKPGDFKKDLWGDADATKYTKLLGCDVQWLNPTTIQHTLKNTRSLKKKVPKSILKKPSKLPAVDTPHPASVHSVLSGISYNPSYKDHQTLLHEVVDKELEISKKEQHLNRVTTKMFSRVTQKENEESWLNEMMEGIPKVEPAAEDVVSDGEYKPVNPPVKDKKKTRQQRRKQKIAKVEANKRKIAAIEKKKIADIYKLRKITHMMEKRELISLKKQAALQRKKLCKEVEAKRLSRNKYEDPDIEFNMPEHLSGNLRGLKLEGNLLKDRFKSLQKRNIVQTTVMQNVHKKGKKKVFTKSTHKDPDN